MFSLITITGYQSSLSVSSANRYRYPTVINTPLPLPLSQVNEFNYQLVAGNEADKFSIDARTGEVTVNKGLDYDSPVNDRTVSGG